MPAKLAYAIHANTDQYPVTGAIAELFKKFNGKKVSITQGSWSNDPAIDRHADQIHASTTKILGNGTQYLEEKAQVTLTGGYYKGCLNSAYREIQEAAKDAVITLPLNAIFTHTMENGEAISLERYFLGMEQEFGTVDALYWLLAADNEDLADSIVASDDGMKTHIILNNIYVATIGSKDAEGTTILNIEFDESAEPYKNKQEFEDSMSRIVEDKELYQLLKSKEGNI